MSNMFVLLALVSAGCATSSKSTLRKPTAIPEAKAVGTSVAKNIDLSVYPLSWVGASTCPAKVNVDKVKDWKDLIKYANRCLSQKKYKDLNYIATKLAETEPALPWGAYYLSLEAEGIGHDERAMWMVDLALKKSPKLGVLKYQKGRLLWKKGFFKESVIEMESALSDDATIVDAHLVLGEAYLSELDFARAEGHYLKVLSTNSTHKVALTGIIDVSIELEKAVQALTYLRTAIDSYPKILNFRLKEAYVYENVTQQADLALTKFKEIQKLVSKKAVEGEIPFDLEAKIKELEATVKSSTKSLAYNKGEK